jgi:hypothetical protein
MRQLNEGVIIAWGKGLLEQNKTTAKKCGPLATLFPLQL